MNNLTSIGLLVTYQCNIECKHCGLSCSPQNDEWMSMDEMKNIAVQASGLGVTCIALTGGEPTLIKHEHLCNYFRFIKKETSISNIRIVTNGHWAKSYDKAYSILKEWKDAGLDELNVSCGEFHQEFVPIENIGHAYKPLALLSMSLFSLQANLPKAKEKTN
jgi:molybdenum cofactor biosynthesis enzyme MoaA